MMCHLQHFDNKNARLPFTIRLFKERQYKEQRRIWLFQIRSVPSATSLGMAGDTQKLISFAICRASLTTVGLMDRNEKIDGV